MPVIVIEEPSEPVPSSTTQVTSFHLPDPQHYAMDQVRAHHEEALDRYGEYAMFVLLWRVPDFDAGLVDRCHTCFIPYGKTAEVFGQPARRRCPDCLGTTFEGGFKAKIVRPSIWNFTEEENREGARGEVVARTASIQSTADFRMRMGDYALRGDGTRFQIQTLSTNLLRTGFETATRDREAVGFNYGQAIQEDESSVSFLIQPTARDALINLLDVTNPRVPQDFSESEIIRGPLL